MRGIGIGRVGRLPTKRAQHSPVRSRAAPAHPAAHASGCRRSMLGVPQHSWRKTQTWTLNRWARRRRAAWAPTRSPARCGRSPSSRPRRRRGSEAHGSDSSRRHARLGIRIRSARPYVSGVGRVQLWGGPLREIRAGDTVWIAPGEKHWHGAGPDTNMVHIALQEALDGSHVAWLEHVTDEQYNAKLGG